MTSKESQYEERLSTGNFVEQNASNSEPLWTVNDVAQYLRLKSETVRAMARRGDLPVVKVGRMWRFKRKLVENWLQQSLEESKEA